MLLPSSVIHPQSPATTQGPGHQSESSSSGLDTGREVFTPDKAEQKQEDPAARAFSNGFLRNTRQHVGFSLGLSESYSHSHGLATSFGEANSVSYSSLAPQLYLNFQGRKLDLHLTYRASYNR